MCIARPEDGVCPGSAVDSHAGAHVLVGEPDPTSPGQALVASDGGVRDANGNMSQANLSMAGGEPQHFTHRLRGLADFVNNKPPPRTWRPSRRSRHWQCR
jgi:hypothetical protein